MCSNCCMMSCKYRYVNLTVATGVEAGDTLKFIERKMIPELDCPKYIPDGAE